MFHPNISLHIQNNKEKTRNYEITRDTIVGKETLKCTIGALEQGKYGTKKPLLVHQKKHLAGTLEVNTPNSDTPATRALEYENQVNCRSCDLEWTTIEVMECMVWRPSLTWYESLDIMFCIIAVAVGYVTLIWPYMFKRK